MRRRRSQGTWLPILGTEAGDEESLIERTTRSVSIDIVAGTLTPLTVVSPVVFDDPQEPNEYTESAALIDLVGNEYLLKRIVGKLWVIPQWRWPTEGNFQTEYATQINAVVVAAGFFVARAADGAAGETSPIGGATVWNDDYSPLNRNQSREPWIWRRSWVLGNPARRAYNAAHYENAAHTPVNMTSYDFAPATNMEFGSVLDGPHIDAKSKRKIGNDDRLWFSMAATSFPPDGAQNFGVSVAATFDVRVFGQIRKAHNRSTF